MKKKITQFRWLVTMLLLVTAMAMPKMAWAEITPQQPSGNGTADSPYQIGTPEELYWFAALVNGTNGLTQNTSANAKLTANIDFGSENFVAIGSESYPFSGTFDGASHAITVNQNGSADVALFGFLGNSTVKNLTVTGTINTTTAKFAAGIAMQTKSGTTANVENCISNVTIESSISGDGTHAGLVGVPQGTLNINNCAFTGAINGASTNSCGGMIGYAKGTVKISNSYISATFNLNTNSCHTFGRNFDAWITLENCYYLNALGDVPASATQLTSDQFSSGEAACRLQGNQTGNIWGQNIDNNQTKQNFPVLGGARVYDNKTLCGNESNPGGVVSIAYSNTPQATVYVQHDMHKVEAKDPTCTKAGNIEYWVCSYEEGVYYKDENGTDKYDSGTVVIPAKGHSYGENDQCSICGGVNTTPSKPVVGEGTSANPYQIGTVRELYWFAALVNGTLTDVAQNTSACAVLVSDITVNTDLLNSLDDNGDPTGTVTIESWTPFGYYNSNTDKACYSGTFDGQGHSINGLYRKQPDEGKISFCGVIGGGTIKNVAIIDSYFEGKFDVGGITGLSYYSGTIINCLYHGIVKGNRMVGGICGAVYDITISDCFLNGEIRKSGDDQQYFGAICGYSAYANHFKNCVYNTDLFNGYAIEDGILESCTLTSVTGMTTEEIASGKATYWLNRYQFGDGSIGWHQNIDNGQNDAYPVLDNTHGMVYASQPCPSSGKFSNNKSSLTEVQHSWGADNVCTQCGKTKDVFDLVGGFEEPSQVDGVYQISTAGELYWFTALVNGNGLLTDGTPPNNSANAVLTSDITVNSNVLDGSGNLAETSDTRLDWIPIGNSDRPYTGTFNGQGHTISGLYFNNSSKVFVGLFGYIYGKIQNTGVIDSYFEGDQAVGGLCGIIMLGEMKDCFSRSFVKGRVEVGGVCGDVCGSKVENAYQAGIVCGSSETATKVNGIFGSISASISGNSQCSNCYYDTTLCPDMNACGSTSSSSATNVEGRPTTEFASGEVAYLLNNSMSDGTQRWYQNLAAEAYPNLNNTDKGNRTVYSAYRHGETTLTYNNNNTHAHAYNSNAANEEDGNHDKSYQGEFTWTDNDNNATVTATFTCSVCGKVVEPELKVEHDDSQTNTVADCTNNGYNYYKTSYAFDGNTISDTYTQTLTALGHDMPGNASLNPEQRIYQKVCQRNGCGVLLGYYATSDGNVVANETESGFVAEALTLADADAKTYDNQAVFTATDFIYTRVFSNTNWTTWYVPFELTLTKDICDKFAFSRINNVHQYDTNDDGKADKTVVESFRQTEGVTLKANYPYLVKALSESDLNMDLNLENVQPALAEEKSIDCQSVDYKYVFTGTYDEMGDSGLGSTDPYTLCEGDKWLHFKSLSPMRHYLTIQSRDASSASPAAMRSIMLSIIGEEDTTGIVKIYDEQRRAKETYDLSGRRLPAGSQRGLVIENGKVVFKK